MKFVLKKKNPKFKIGCKIKWEWTSSSAYYDDWRWRKDGVVTGTVISFDDETVVVSFQSEILFLSIDDTRWTE